jgi:hypothetical protein
MEEIYPPLASSRISADGVSRRGSKMPTTTQAVRCFDGLPLLTLNSMIIFSQIAVGEVR